MVEIGPAAGPEGVAFLVGLGCLGLLLAAALVGLAAWVLRNPPGRPNSPVDAP